MHNSHWVIPRRGFIHWQLPFVPHKNVNITKIPEKNEEPEKSEEEEFHVDLMWHLLFTVPSCFTSLLIIFSLLPTTFTCLYLHAGKILLFNFDCMLICLLVCWHCLMFAYSLLLLLFFFHITKGDFLAELFRIWG